MGRLSRFRGTIAWGLIYVIALSTVLTPRAYAPDPDAPGLPIEDNVPQPMGEFVRLLETAREGDVPPILNLDLEASQYRRIYEPDPKDPAKDILVREIPLATLDLTPTPDIANFEKEVHVQYDRARKELSFVHTEKYAWTDPADGQKRERVRITDAHVYKNTEVTSNIIQDANFFMFGTRAGVRAIFRKDITKHFCSAPVLAPVAILHSDGQHGETITHLEFLERKSEPRQFFDRRSYFDGGDVGVTFTFPQGNTVESSVDRAEIIMMLRMRVLGALARLVVANPDPALANEIALFLRENEAELMKYQAQQEALLHEAGTNELQNHALKTLAQREDIRGMLDLFKKKNGQDAFERLAAAPRDRISADPSADGEWMKDFLAIQAGFAADRDKPEDARRSWKQILVDNFEDADGAKARATAVAEGNFLGRTVDKTFAFFSKVATTRNLCILGLVVGGTAVNYNYDNVPVQWAMATLTHMLEYTTKIPVVNTVTGPIFKNLGYFTDVWRVSRWVAGVGIISTFYYASVFAGRVASVLQRHPEWSALRTFFNIGVQTYGRLCYPVQKIAYDFLRQRNLYVALDNGLNPLRTRAAWNAPWASEEKIRQNAEALGRAKETETTLRMRSMMIAAAIVSKTQENAGTPIDMATLIMAGQGTQIATIAALPMHERARWTELTTSVYASLQELGDGPIDQTMIAEYHKILTEHVEEIRYEQEHSKEWGLKLRSVIKGRWQNTCELFSKNIVPFVMFGKQGYDTYRLFRRAEISDNTAKVAGEQYAKDYLISAGLYGASAAKKFGDIISLGPNAWEVLTNQMSQVFIYGIQGAIDPMSAEVLDPLSNPYPPLSNDLYREGRERTQTVTEALADVTSKMTDPKADITPLEMHAKVMENTLKGLQVRLAADYLTRSLGMYLTPTKPGAVPLTPGGAMLTSAPLALYFLLAKISVSPSGVGYMVIWPYVQLAMMRMQEGPQKNLLRVQMVDYLIDTGKRLNNRQMVEDGIRHLQGLYKEGGIEVPKRFAVEPEKFTDEMAARFHEHSMSVVPLPTKPNGRAIDFVNIGLGVTISNLFFDAASSVAYESTTPWMLAAKTVGYFAATYVGLRLAGPVYRKANAAIRSAYNSFRGVCDYVMGKAGAPVAGTP